MKLPTFVPTLDITAGSVLDRLLHKTAAGPDACVIYTGGLDTGKYGQVSVGGRMQRAHRVAYELLVGPIPEGLHIDHTCHNRDTTCPGGRECLHRRCINPHHLEPVTPGENTRRSTRALAGVAARKTHCDSGHPFNEANTYVDASGHRFCRPCRRRRYAEAKAGAR